MIEFQNDLTIEVKLDQAYDFLSKLDNFPTWNYAVSNVKKLNKRDEKGRELYGIFRDTMGPRYEEGYVKELTKGEKIVLAVSGGWFPYEMEYQLKKVDDKTEVTNIARIYPTTLTFVPLQIVKLQLQQAVKQNLNVLKGILENITKN